MKTVREEVMAMLDTFEAYGITEENQRALLLDNPNILDEALYFKSQHYSLRDKLIEGWGCLKFARFLDFCSNMGIKVNANKLVKYNWDVSPEVFEILEKFDEYDEMQQKMLKQEGKKAARNGKK